MKTLCVLLLLFIAFCRLYDPGGYEIFNGDIVSGLVPTYSGPNSTKLDIIIDYQDSCDGSSVIRVSSDRDQCDNRYVGINNLDPVCSLDVNGDICLNGVAVVTSPWASTDFLILPSATNTVQTFTPSIQATVGTLVDIAIVHSSSKAFTRAFSNSSADYGISRGASAIDFQMNRSSATQVASARSSVILNGDRGELSGNSEYGTLLNGLDNYCGSKYGLIGNGRLNNIAFPGGLHSTIVNGDGHVINTINECSTIVNGRSSSISGTMTYGTITNGLFNQCTDASYCFIANGQINSISGFSYITILNGLSNTATGPQSSILGGSGTSVSGDTSSSVMCNGCIITGDRSAILVGDSSDVRSFDSVALYGFNVDIETGGSYNLAGGNNVFIGSTVTYCHAFGISSTIGNGASLSFVFGSSSGIGASVTRSMAFGSAAAVETNSADSLAFGNSVSIGSSSSRNMAFGSSVTIGNSVTDSFAFGTSVNIVRRQNIFAFGNDIVVTPTLIGSFVVQQLFGVGLRNGPNVGLFTAFGQYNNIANSYVGEERIFTYGIGGSLASTANIWSLTNSGNMRISGSYLAGPAFNQASFFEHNLGTKLEPGTVVQLNYDDGTIEQCDFYTPTECFGVVTEVGAGFVGDAYEEEWHGKYIRTLHAEHYKKKLSPHFKPEQEYKPRSSRDEWHIVVTSGFIEIKNGEPVHPLWRAIPNKKNPPALDGYTWHHLRNI